MEAALDMKFSEVPDGMNVMAVPGLEGDTKHIWNKNEPAGVDAARELFTRLKLAGYAGFYVTGKDGVTGESMHAFDPKAERMIMIPPMQGG